MADTSVFESIHQIIADKGLSREKVIEIIQQALLSAYKKTHGGSNANVDAYFDKDSETIKLLVTKYVVENVENEQSQISLADAKKIKPNAEIGDEIPIEESMENFGRIAIQTAKQVVLQRMKELERDMIYREYKGKEGELINGYFQRANRDSIFVDLGKTDGVLRFSEKMPRERFRYGDRIKALILSVQNTNKGPQILLSRTHENFVKKLFELEIPEVYDGIVRIENIVREPGYRTKVAVNSERDDIDPVGTCVGMKGMRIQAIVREINNEKIDIVEYNPDYTIFIMRAMQPAKVREVILVDDKTALAVINDEQLSYALGRNGANVKLASRLTGMRIDVKNEAEYQQYIEERREKSRQMADEIFGQPEEKEEEAEGTPLDQLEGLTSRLVEMLASAGVESVEDLIELSIEDLTQIDGIGQKTAEQIYSIILENFEFEEVE